MISVRLESLATYVNYNDKIIDIGCDHALLDIYLVKNKLVRSIIACDIHEGALESGKNNVSKENLSDKIDLRLGDGLSVLKKNDVVNTILISGMGTSTIVEILNNPYLTNINKLIIQSNNDHMELRKKITKLGFEIKSESFIVDNNKHYINIVFVRGEHKYLEREFRYGPILIHNKAYLQFELDNCNKILSYIPKNKFILRFKLKKEIRLIKKLMK
ncbi:MAG TPA: class I SAM-dependent methyltransferase [Bacilli bacterium]|jgi:tRNA (adenine22-N1)-methyltransferase|nr:class I SAM-dependent methyltransferase [Bacilli bacterium]HPZ23839.1 class I SAM-dependent methyltransferase [Bacilli bacterium]HQC83896.1 class I SAM-dependent methyltransferase [Bacilli bacterium]